MAILKGYRSWFEVNGQLQFLRAFSTMLTEEFKTENNNGGYVRFDHSRR